MDLITILPVVTKDLPISPRFTPYHFFIAMQVRSTLTTCQPMVEFYLLTFPRFRLRKKEHKFYFGKNRTHDFRTSRCAAYLLYHSGDDTIYLVYIYIYILCYRSLTASQAVRKTILLFTLALTRVWLDVTIIDINTILLQYYSGYVGV